MIVNILRKDLTLLWKPVVAVILLYAATAAISTTAWHHKADSIVAVLFVAAFYLLTAVVHLDTIPGNRADWLTRPIRRRDLLVAKLLFAVVAIVVPMCLIDMTVGMAMGFDMSLVVSASMSHAGATLFGLILPAMALASATRNIGECVIGAVGIVIVIALSQTVLQWTLPGRELYFNLSWVEDFAVFLVVLLAATLVLSLQYFRRKTAWSMAVAVLACLVSIFGVRIGWASTWALQTKATPAGRFAESASVRFDAERGPFRLPATPQAEAWREKDLRVYLPIAFEGLPTGEKLIVQRATLRLRFADGQVLEAAAPAMRLSEIGNELRYQPFFFGNDPRAVLLRDLNAQAELSFWFLGVKPGSGYDLELQGGGKQIPGLGKCDLHPDGRYWIVNCLTAGRSTGGAMIADSRGAIVGRLDLSEDALQPFFLRYLPFLVTPKRASLSIDPSSRESRVHLETFGFQGVLDRRLTIPNLRLADWD